MADLDIPHYTSQIQNCIDHTQFFDAKDMRLSSDAAMEMLLGLVRGLEADGKKLMIVGNGGSASIASHFAIDFTKVGGVRAVCFSDAGQLTCLSNDFSYEEVFSKSVELYGDAGDVLIAISSSGQSKNILNAAAAARKMSIQTITLSGFRPDNSLSKSGDLNIYTPSSVYGTVEIAHSIILHALLDHIVVLS